MDTIRDMAEVSRGQVMGWDSGEICKDLGLYARHSKKPFKC